MAEDISATERKADLTRILAIAKWLPHQVAQSDITTQDCGMLPALVRAQNYYRLRDWEKMLNWVAIAENAPAIPVEQKSIFISIAATILPDETIVIPYIETEWRLSHNNDKADLKVVSPEEVQIKIPNQKDIRDSLIYTWSKDINIAYQPLIHLDVWLKQGTYFTVETVTDRDLRVRHLSYYQGKGRWISLDLPSIANTLNEIKFSLSEPPFFESTPPGAGEDFYEAFIRAPTLNLSPSLGLCNAVAQNK